MSQHRPGRKLLVIGGGGHAWVVTEAARAQGWTVLGFFDDDRMARLDEQTPRLGSLADAERAGASADLPPGFPPPPSRSDADEVPMAIIALGSLAVRSRLIRELSGLYGVVKHPACWVSPSARLGSGTFVGAMAVVQGRAEVGEHTIINTGAIVEHDCRVGVNVHIAPRAALGGNVTVGPDTLIGLGACVKPGVRIGSQVTVGAGAVVVRDVPDGRTVMGVPAREEEAWKRADGG